MRCYTLDLETLRPREVDGTQIVQRVPTQGQASVYMAQVPSPSGSDRLVAPPRGASHPGEKSSRAAGGSSMGTRENRSAFLAQLKREKLTRAKLDALVERHDLSADAQTVSKQRWWWWALFLPSEYGLNPTPHTNEGCTDADCDDVMVLETVNGGGSSKEGLGAKVDRGSSYTIDGDVVGRSIFGKAPVGEEVGFFDSTPDEVASRIPGVYSMAPDELRSLWPTMEGYWDDPSCTWLYYRFKEAAIEDITAKNACNDPLNAATETEEVYVVSGMMPFLAYDLRSVDSVIVCQGGVQKLLIRVRYLAVFIHHFSFCSRVI